MRQQWISMMLVGLGLAVVAGFGTPAMAQLGDNSCIWANDGECDDPTVPGHMTTACAPGTDANDCSNPAALIGGGSQQGGNTGAGGSPDTYAPWTRITNDQRHYATQPGGVLGLLVTGGMAFEAGTYTIYHGLTDGSGPQSPIWNIQSETVVLVPGERYIARASGGGLVSFAPGGGALTMYPQPQRGYAMIYARNDDVTHWRAMCVVPSGWPIAYCGN